MFQGENPFLKSAIQHAQMVLHESNRALSTSQALVAACNDTVGAAQAGNLQGTLASAQKARHLAGDVTSSVQTLNFAINTHFERASYVLGKIQARVNEVANVVQNARLSSGLPLTSPMNIAPWQSMAPWQYGATQTWSQPPLM